MAITIGQQAPEFALFDSDKKEIKLSDYKGKNVLLLFFPLAFTGTCTAELCSIRDNYGVYNDLDAQVLGISVDSLFVLDKFKKEQNLNFPLLSDFNKEVSTAYGALHEKFAFGMQGVSKRSAFLVDKNGVIQYAEVLDVPTELPNFTAIQDILKGLNA